MPRRLAGIAAVFAILSALVCCAGGAAASRPRSAHRGAALPHAGGILIRTNSQEALPAHGGTVDSTNWSGYAVTPSGGGITAVDSTFTVPSAEIVPPGFAATWAGIGGYSTSDLIQAGVAEDSLPSLPLLGDQYYAWYELLPNSEVQLSGCSGDASCTVSPGDTVTVHIYQQSGNTWTISVVDNGNWSWQSDVNYASSGSSAEWILEAPTIEGLQSTLADTGTTFFGNTSTYTAGGQTLTIAQGDPTQVDLTAEGLLPEATPSSLADGQSFNDCAYASSCAAP